MQKGAVICAQGIGDGLLMMIAAANLKKEGFAVEVFHSQPHTLSPLFQTHKFRPYPSLKNWEEQLKPFDLVLVENDNSQIAWHLFSLRDQNKLSSLVFFFPTPSIKQTQRDILFDPHTPVASNIAQGCSHILNKQTSSKENDLTLPLNKIHRRFSNRIVIHPTSNDPKRNWRPSQFLKLAHLLKKKGYSISFTVGPNEHEKWVFVQNLGFHLPFFKTLRETADYLYESGFFIGNDSGLGHLTSNLYIPTLTISGHFKRICLWRPDWGKGEVVTPPFPLPNFKGIHFPFRTHFWPHFIRVRRTLKAFHQLQHALTR